MIFSSIIGRLGKFKTLKKTGAAAGADDVLNVSDMSWTPGTIADVLTVGDGITDAEVTPTPSGVEVTLDTSAPIGSEFFAFASPPLDFAGAAPPDGALYFKVVSTSAVPSTGDGITVIAYDDPLAPNFGAELVSFTLEGGAWTMRSITGGTLRTFTTPELLSTVFAVGTSRAGGTDLTVSVYTSPVEVFPATASITPGTVPRSFLGLYVGPSADNRGVAVQQLTTPPVIYAGLQPYATGASASLDPASYPPNRAGRTYTIRGLAEPPSTVLSALGPVSDGMSMGFDLLGEPAGVSLPSLYATGVTYTASHTLVPEDHGKTVRMDVAGSESVTLPAGLPPGFRCRVALVGPGGANFLAGNGAAFATWPPGATAISERYLFADVLLADAAGNVFAVQGALALPAI